jgi:sterol desaturase/sphingolipid hydroxylase (fatty acid hydroxylase superfamily)
MALVNVFPLLASGIILGLNFQTMRVWHIVAVSNTIIVAHGGYTCFGRSAHDIHHLYKTCNYGIFGFLDKAHGTLITSN